MLLATACGGDTGGDSTGGKDEGPLLIGVVQPQSGPFAATGLSMIQGMKAQADAINDQGGILGRQIKLEIRDDGSDPQRSRAAVLELSEMDGIAAILPSAIAASTLSALPVTTQKKLYSASSCSAVECGDPSKYPYNFTVSLPFPLQMEAYLTATKQLFDPASIGFIVSNDTSGEGFAAAGADLAGKKGIDVTGTERFDPAGTDFTPLLQKLRASNPDVLLTWASGQTIGVVMRAVRDLGWDVPVIATSTVAIADLGSVVPAEVADQLHIVTYKVASRLGNEIRPEFADIVKRASKYGDISSMVGVALGADTLTIYKYGVEQAKSFDTEKLVAAAERMGDDKNLPDDFLFGSGNPHYNSKQHAANEVGLCSIYAVVQISERIDGTYAGSDLEC
jgi:branched-chain amino acid transport system substrate-binding protein